ncbi:MAG: metal-dependent hydrolase [Pseudomonadota bacterium]
MHPVTHLLLGWGLATATPLHRRDRALVALAGVIPDLDGLGIVAEKLTLHTEHPLYWYASFHHVLAHNLPCALLVTATAAALARRRVRTPVLVAASFHVHLLADLLGARGPDGATWPIRYLWPFSGLELSWAGQWEFNAWPNFAITLAALAWMFWVAGSRGCSPLELISKRADKAFCGTVRGWLGRG